MAAFMVWLQLYLRIYYEYLQNIQIEYSNYSCNITNLIAYVVCVPKYLGKLKI